MAQEIKRDQTVRLPNPSAQPFVTALKTARFFAVLFFWVTMVCVLAHVAAFVAAEWVCLYDGSGEVGPAAPVEVKPAAPAPAPTLTAPAATAPAAPAPATPAPKPSATSWALPFERTALAAQAEPTPAAPTATGTGGGPGFFGVPPQPRKEGESSPAAAPPATPSAVPTKGADTEGKVVGQPETPVPERLPLTPEQKRDRAEYYHDLTLNLLKPLRIVGVLSSFMLGATLFLYLQIALLGRLAGIKQLTNALFLLLLFLGAVLPWENIFEGFRVNVFYDFTRLMAMHADRLAGGGGDFWSQARYFARFLALPLGSVVLLAWSGIQFAAGYKDSVVANE